jgi:hypothetical protein|tara:strand:+ start:935 stop:1240 length:306 start_codon:yes stop_codon:yes gene_type:complete
MPQFKVTYPDGTVRIHLATLDRVKGYVKDGGFFEEMTEPPPSDSEIKADARGWRNSALRDTDKFVSVTDHPDHAKIMDLRVRLRNWPSTDDFPDTKPTLGS